jgi:hypothetical protein
METHETDILVMAQKHRCCHRCGEGNGTATLILENTFVVFIKIMYDITVL